MAKLKVAAIAPLYHPGIGRKEMGEKFEMDEADAPRYVEAKLIVVLSGNEVVAEEAKVVDMETSSLEELKKAWDMEISPADYLDRFPTGPQSDLALRIVELEAEQA